MRNVKFSSDEDPSHCLTVSQLTRLQLCTSFALVADIYLWI